MKLSVSFAGLSKAPIQTCRSLHEICSFSSIWYNVYKHLPVESKWQDLNVNSIPSSAWQSFVLKAIETDLNWRRTSSPQLSSIRKVCEGKRSGVANHVRLFNKGKALLWISYPSNRSLDSHSSIVIWDIGSSSSPQVRQNFDSLGFGSLFDIYEGSGRVVFAYGGDVNKAHAKVTHCFPVLSSS